MSRKIGWIPLALFVLVAVGLLWRVSTPSDTRVPSRLEGQKVPGFALGPAIDGKPDLAAANLANGKVHLVNIFASWCVPCVAEAAVLGELKSRGVAIDGVAIRDRPEDVAAFLARHGDPFERIGADPQSQLQIALGSSGVPESFVVDGRGIIRYQHIGPIERSDIPLIVTEIRKAQ